MRNSWSSLGGCDCISQGILSQVMLQWILPGFYIFLFNCSELYSHKTIVIYLELSPNSDTTVYASLCVCSEVVFPTQGKVVSSHPISIPALYVPRSGNVSMCVFMVFGS